MAPPGWRIGDPLTDEMKAKRAAKIEANRAAKAAGKPPKPAKPRKPHREAAPVRTPSGVTAKMRVAVIKLVGHLIGAIDGSAAWAMARVERPIYATDPATGEIMVDAEKRAIIEGKVRAISDETIAADRLEDWERDYLAEELTDEFLKYKALRMFLIRMVDLQEKSSLPMCVIIISLPRLVRHGIVPEAFTALIKDATDAARKARHAPRGIVDTAGRVEPEIPEPVAAAAD